MSSDTLDLARGIAAAKAELRRSLPNYREVFAEVAEELGREADTIAGRLADGEQVVPSIQYADIVAGTVAADDVAAMAAWWCAACSRAPRRRRGTPNCSTTCSPTTTSTRPRRAATSTSTSAS